MKKTFLATIALSAMLAGFSMPSHAATAIAVSGGGWGDSCGGCGGWGDWFDCDPCDGWGRWGNWW